VKPLIPYDALFTWALALCALVLAVWFLCEVVAKLRDYFWRRQRRDILPAPERVDDFRDFTKRDAVDRARSLPKRF